MKENGITLYEMGEANPNFKEEKERTLINFKKSFGGQLRPYIKGNKVYRKMLKTVLEYWHSIKGSK